MQNFEMLILPLVHYEIGPDQVPIIPALQGIFKGATQDIR